MGHRSPRNLPIFPLTVLALILLALLPHGASGWAGALRGPFVAVIAPVAWVSSSLSIWLRSGEGAGDETPRATREALEGERDAFARMWHGAVRENERLRGLIEDLQGGRTYPPPTPIDVVAADRIGHDLGAGTIEVNRGTGHGVTPDAVVVTRRGEQIVGLVKRVSGLTSTAHLVTDAGLDPGLVVGAIMAGDGSGPETIEGLPHCQLRPAGDGTLVDGQFGIGPGDPSLLEGSVVRIDDETWPGAAQLLVLGRVTGVEATDRPLFRRLVVRPTVDVSRQRSMLIRVPSRGGGGEGPE